MALRAIRGKSRGFMVRIRNAVIFTRMARIAIRGSSCIDARNMAARAWNGCMRSRQREFSLAMIIYRWSPRHDIVANRARCGESGGGMRRVLRVVILLKMTIGAIGRGSGKFSAFMALNAWQLGMRAEKRKSG